MSTSNEKPIVLVVDDMPESMAVLGELLQPDYHVRIANSGQRALDVATSEPHSDLILLDVMMPGMEGYEVLTHLRAKPEACDIPVIFVTAIGSVARTSGSNPRLPVACARTRSSRMSRCGRWPVWRRPGITKPATTFVALRVMSKCWHLP